MSDIAKELAAQLWQRFSLAATGPDEIEAVVREVLDPLIQAEKPAINTNVRLFDLVCYMRAELHDAQLIDDEEYAWLLSNAPRAGGSVDRLHDYDDVRAQLRATIAEKDREIERLKADKPAINTNVRLFDLVRYARAYLHGEQLIDMEEYAWLCGEAPMSKGGGSPSPRRLEDYDKIREREKQQAAELARMRALCGEAERP